MELQDKERKHEPFDCAAGMAAGLFASGAFIKVKPVIKQAIPNTTWEIRAGEKVEWPPYLYCFCATCASRQHSEGPTVHKTAKFLHCGVVESCPPEIAKHYVKARDDFKGGNDGRGPYYLIPTHSALGGCGAGWR